ncbi:transcription repressor NadR [Peribacillus muralis]|uniref:transcription repressor NadR n=1 Tax=Peribacillus muralis TaxID=264697 RepID=UPI00070EE7F3|nr:transcription repressor NadR [Peribacillus muralis]
MMEKKKLRGEERRTKLLHILQTSTQPVTGNELSQMTNVSRQVIVGDITLLKARNEPIIATSQGYMYLPVESTKKPERIIACQHDPSRTQEELFLLVDIGVTVKDVKIEHPVYGDLTASIMVSSRKEVQQFLSRVSATNASFLSELTSGIHLHTVSAATEDLLDEAEVALRDAGILVD